MVGDPEIMRRLDRLGERYLAESRELAGPPDRALSAGPI
jgi:hypothetical protein